ncbi:MAG: hypothetical protein J6W40_02485 [Alphaproteobacteria bacterium]|nr:hypothetical protein [Alphaproteobacteria bacterium]
MRVKYGILSILCMFGLAHVAGAAPISTTSSSIQPISQYGLIQNVQNYSSNPFWNPNGLYNQRMPQPIYAQGADLNTADCQRTVGTLVAAYCMDNNNCVGMQLSDIRPAMMLRLARLPGHNYATSCAGFIDSEFESYVSKYNNAGPTYATVPFPAGTVANPALNETEYKIENPYQIRNRTWNNEEWEKEKKERYQELQELQSMNGANDIYLARADYPATANDLTFSETLDLKKAGYEPYKTASPYATPFKLEKEDDAISRKKTAFNDYCKLHKDDPSCPQPQANNTPPGGGGSNSECSNDSQCGAGTCVSGTCQCFAHATKSGSVCDCDEGYSNTGTKCKKDRIDPDDDDDDRGGRSNPRGGRSNPRGGRHSL